MEAGRPWSWSYRRLWASLTWVCSFGRAARTVTQVISSLLGKACRKLINSENTTYAKKENPHRPCFHFYLMFPNVKKSRFLHQLEWDHKTMQSVSSFSASYSVIDKELDGTCLVGKCHFFTKAPHRAVSSFLQVNNLSSGFCLCVFVLLGRHMELKNLAARFHSATSRISTNSSFSTAHCRGLRR